MKNLVGDICSSIIGNTKTRINDPFIGTFLCTWVICNWNYLALLFFGEGSPVERIGSFYIFLTQTPLIEWNSLLSVPLSITLFYLFLFPWVSLGVKGIQSAAVDKLHNQAVGIEIKKVTQQLELNKATLKADPDKTFLEQIVQQDIDKKEEILKHIRLRTAKMDSKVQEVRDRAKEQEENTREAESRANSAQVEYDKKLKQDEIEKLRFSSNRAKAQAALASHRFPSAYYLMAKISNSIKQDQIYISIETSGEIVAALFGYQSFELLLSDKTFNNNTISDVKYIYYDDDLSARLEAVVQQYEDHNEDVTSDLIFDHLMGLFDAEPIELVTLDRLGQYAVEKIEEDPFNLIHEEGVSGASAESSTTFEDFDDIHSNGADYDNGFVSEILVSASGSHYRDSDIPGRTMTISASVQANAIVGKFGLGSLELGEVTGTLDEFE
ncbi:hypothetical protein [Aliivibrio salmonicida]|uniref:hypothetical protein n=1 Tax=Aliivibrio salmonicida TaxID=40269 RepID=UPI003D13926B